MEYVEPRLNRGKQAILKTLSYSDIFDFPLRLEELWGFLVSDSSFPKELFEAAVDKLLNEGQIFSRNQYFCLKGREKIIQKRYENLPEVDKKLEIAQKAAWYLSYIPMIQFIGISGGLAMHDADAEDDIDFFIIVKRKTLFITRICILGLLQILKLRRKRLDKNPADKICVNFMLDESSLNFPKDKRDIYIAHEIVQIKPLFERDLIYRKFLRTNRWVKKFFPNAKPQKSYLLQGSLRIRDCLSAFVFILNLRPFANLAKLAQIRYLKEHQTTEYVSDSVIAFHPNDYRVQTLKKMNLKLRQLGLLTKA